MSLLAGGSQLAYAAVMMEPLPDSANLPEKISGVTSSAVQSGNRILVTGGQKENSSTFSQHSYTFNPTDRSWTSLAPSLQLSFHKQSMLKDGRVLVTGGSKFILGTGYIYNNMAKIYSPYSNTWSDGASLPVGSIFGNTQSTLLDGRVLIVGGANEIWSGVDRSTMYNQAYLYDPGTNRWEEAAPYPYPIYDAAQSTLKDGRVLVTGGLSHYVYRFDAYLYDPSNNTWTKAASLPYEGDTFSRHAQVTLPDGKVLVMGKKYFYIYDPATNQWTKDTAAIRQLTNAQLSVFGNDVYAMGGYDENWETNVNVYKLTFDFTPPTAPTISGPGPEWSTQDVTAVITPGTDADSGVARTEYSLSGATTLGWTPYNDGDKITISNDGQTTISARTIDLAGNISPIATAVVKIDRTAPAQPAVKLSAASWTASDVRVTIAPGIDSGGSGVHRTEFSLAGATTLGWTTYTGLVTIMAEGQTTVSARTIDNAGNIGGVGTAVVSIDKTAPVAPAVALSTTQWTAAPNVTVTIAEGADSGGSGVNRTEYSLKGATTLGWTVYTGPLAITAEGQTTVSARTIDNAGNISVSASAAAKIDRTPPGAPIVTSPLADEVLSNRKPTVTGTAEANATVTITLDGGASMTVTADGSGRWSYTPADELADGVHRVKASAKDAAGNGSPDSAERSFTVDTIPPAPPAIDAPLKGAWINSRRPVVSGQAEAGATVTLYLNAVPAGTTAADVSGSWTYSWPADLADGPYSLKASAADAAGNASPDSAVVSFTVDTAAPLAPVVLAPADGTVTNQSKPVIRGTAEAHATVKLLANGSPAGTVTADAEGGWTFIPLVALGDRSYTLQATAADAAGNISPPSVEVRFTVDTSAPPAPVITNPANGAVTNRLKPAVAGTAEAGATVSVYIDEWLLTETAADTEGSWSHTPADSLPVGRHTVKAQATDAAGNRGPLSASHTFTVVSDNALLRSLQLSSMTLNETVTGTTYRYTAQVPYSVTATAVTAVPVDGNASVLVLQDGEAVSGPLRLRVGAQTITIQVTAQDGTTIQLYTVLVTRLPSSEVQLSELTLSHAALTPEFQGGTTRYTATVTNDVYSLTVRAKAVSSEATIRINGHSFANGEAVLPVELQVGGNPMTIAVTAQDGSTTQSYTVTVHRKPSSNVLLNGLLLSEGSLNPAFDSGIVHYEAEVEHGVTSLTVTASVYDRDALLTVNGREAASQRPSQKVELQVGVNRLTIAVTAQDRISTQAYTVEVTRKPSPYAGLTGLRLAGAALSPAFDSEITAYEASVSHEIDSTTVTASVYDRSAKLSINGEETVGSEASIPVALQAGITPIRITVTAPDGQTVRTYTVRVRREAAPEQPSDASSEENTGGGGTTAPVEKPQVPQKPAAPVKPQAVPDKPAGASSACIPAAKLRFADLSGHWAESSVSEASGCGIVDGFDDGTFRPNDPVTRAQFITMLVRAKGFDKSGPTVPASIVFADREAISSWAAVAVSVAAQRGIVNGYEDRTFRPDELVTRAEMITMTARASNLQTGPEAELSMFADAADIPDWAEGYVAAAWQNGTVQGRENGRFAPQEHTTRAEAAVLLLRWIRLADQ